MTEINTKETKIVKATPKKQDAKETEPRVTVKAAVIPQRGGQQAKPAAQTTSQAKPQTTARRQFIGTPVVNKDLENRTSRIPRGMTPVAKEVTEKAIGERVQEQPKVEVSEQAPVKEAPKTEAASEVKAETVKKEEPKAEEVKSETKKAKKEEPKAEVKE